MSWPQQRTSRSTDASEKWRHCEGRSTARRGRRETTWVRARGRVRVSVRARVRVEALG